MKHRNLLSLALAFPLLAAFASKGDEISFHVAKETTLTKVFENESTLSLDNLSMEMNGQDMSEMIGKMEVTAKSSQTVKVKDNYIELGSGRPAKLQRTFEQLGSKTAVSMKSDNPMVPASDQDMSGKSELEGRTVVFTPAKEGDGYDVAYAGDQKGDDELLKGLTEDMDLRGLLPEGAKSKGESWTIPASAMGNILAPGGDLKIKPDGEAEMSMMGGGSQGGLSEMLGDLEGDVTATYTGTEEDGGVRVAVIKLKFKIKSARDITEQSRVGLEKVKEKAPGMEIEVESSDVEITLGGEGEVRWDLAAGHLHSLELSGDMGMNLENASKMSMGGKEMSQKMSMEMSGSFSQKISFEH